MVVDGAHSAATVTTGQVAGERAGREQRWAGTGKEQWAGRQPEGVDSVTMGNAGFYPLFLTHPHAFLLLKTCTKELARIF